MLQVSVCVRFQRSVTMQTPSKTQHSNTALLVSTCNQTTALFSVTTTCKLHALMTFPTSFDRNFARILDMMTQLLAGVTPSLQDVILIRTAMMQSFDLYAPIGINERIFSTVVDVSDSLLRLLHDPYLSAIVFSSRFIAVLSNIGCHEQRLSSSKSAHILTLLTLTPY